MISIQTRGLDDLNKFFAGLLARLQDLRPAWSYIREDFWLLEREQFESEGKYVGGWPALSPRYAAWKAQHFPGRKILELYGRLKASMTGMTPDTVWQAEPQKMTIGTTVPYAAVHQTGHGLPERAFLVVPHVRASGWAASVVMYLLGVGTGLRPFDRRSLF